MNEEQIQNGLKHAASILEGLPSSDAYIRHLIDSNMFVRDLSDLDDGTFSENLITLLQRIKKKDMLVVSLIGGTASGKTTLVKNLLRHLPRADSISPDDFLVHDTPWRREHVVAAGKPSVEKYDPGTMISYVQKIRSLRKGGIIKVPRLDYATGKALAVGEKYFPHEIKAPISYLIIEGDFHFIHDSDLVIYFHVPDEVRNRNRFIREIRGKGETDLDRLYADMRNRHVQQQLQYTLPVAASAHILVTVQPQETDQNIRYYYSIYKKSAS